MFHEKQFGLFAAGSFLNEPARFFFSSCDEQEVLFNQPACGIKMFHEKQSYLITDMCTNSGKWNCFMRNIFSRTCGRTTRCITDFLVFLVNSICPYHISGNLIIQNVS